MLKYAIYSLYSVNEVSSNGCRKFQNQNPNNLFFLNMKSKYNSGVQATLIVGKRAIVLIKINTCYDREILINIFLTYNKIFLS